MIITNNGKSSRVIFSSRESKTGFLELLINDPALQLRSKAVLAQREIFNRLFSETERFVDQNADFETKFLQFEERFVFALSDSIRLQLSVKTLGELIAELNCNTIVVKFVQDGTGGPGVKEIHMEYNGIFGLLLLRNNSWSLNT